MHWSMLYQEWESASRMNFNHDKGSELPLLYPFVNALAVVVAGFNLSILMKFIAPDSYIDKLIMKTNYTQTFSSYIKDFCTIR